MSLMWLIMAGYGCLQGILALLPKPTDHPSLETSVSDRLVQSLRLSITQTAPQTAPFLLPGLCHDDVHGFCMGRADEPWSKLLEKGVHRDRLKIF